MAVCLKISVIDVSVGEFKSIYCIFYKNDKEITQIFTDVTHFF